MVDDKEIKAKVSPFAIRNGEIKVFDGKDCYIAINAIIKKVDLGHITDIHFLILEIVNELEFVTSRQIYQLLEKKGIELKSQDSLNNKLETMVKSKMLTRYYFDSPEGKSIYKVYCLEKMGKYLLESREIDCKWYATDNTKPVSMIKKRLAANQVLLAYLRKSKSFENYEVKRPIIAKQLSKTFKVPIKIRLKVKNKSVDILFEIMRREKEWKKTLIEKIKLYKDFYENFVKYDSSFENIPQLVLVCEDEKNMAEVFKEIVKNKLEIQKIKMYFTTDLRQNGEKLSNSLVEFKIDENTGKYKMFETELKLLS